MVDTLLDKIRRGIGALTGAVAAGNNPGTDDPLPRNGAGIARRAAKHFDRLGKAAPGLDRQIGAYVASGDLSSVLSTLASAKVTAAWAQRTRSYPPRDESGLFASGVAWDAAQMRRLGEALSALETIQYEGWYFGSKKSPEWLRQVVTQWLGHGRKDQSIDQLAALAAETDLGLLPVLDILFGNDVGNYQSHNSVGRFTGVAPWLEAQRGAVIAALPALGADQRAEFAAAIGRLGLADAFLEPLAELAIGSSKKARESARQALTGADTGMLQAHLAARHPQAAPSARAELVELAAASLGERAAGLLAEWKAGETAPRALAAIERVTGSFAPAAAEPGAAGPADGPGGYTAVDGSWVATPPRPMIAEVAPITDAMLALLRPAAATFNVKLAAAQAEAGRERWHWSRQFSKVGQSQFDMIRKLGESAYQIGNQQNTALGWIRSQEGRASGVDVFFDDPRLSLWHSVRFALASTNGYFASVFSDWAGPPGSALARRIAAGADIRVVLELWTRFGGRDPISEHLAAMWYQPFFEQDMPFWTALCDRFDLLDEAFGLKPRSETRAFAVRSALDLLALFPKVPRRYQQPLMLLASGSSATLRGPARQLLRAAPGIDDAIAGLLDDGRQDVRAGAAEWLAQRDARDKVATLRRVLKKERSELARAAMITALERLGDDVSDFFDSAAMIKEADAALAKAKDKALAWFPFAQLPALRWRSGEALDPRIPIWWVTLAARLKQPGGNALIELWLDRLAPGDAHRLGWMVLTSWIEQDTRTCTEEEANQYAAAHVAATLKHNIDAVKRYPQAADYYATDRDTVFAQLRRVKLGTYLGSAVDSKGILALATRVDGADAAQKVRPFLKDHGARTSQAKALLEMLASNPAGAALQLVLAASNRSKQRSVQAHAGTLVEAVADRRGWSAEELADRTVPTAGLDADGTIDLDCGRDRTYLLSLDGADGLILVNADGKEVKALPAPRIDEEKPLIEAAKKLVSTARKESKQVFASQTERLREAMYLGRRWRREDWEGFLVAHPLVGRLARRLIWLGVDGEGRIAGAFRPLGDGSYTDAADEDVALAGFAEVQLAHRSLLDADAIGAWQRHLADYEVAPPFDQVGRILPEVTEAMRGKQEIRDREGWMIETFKLRGIATKLGYVRGAAGDGGWFTGYERPYRSAGIVAEIEFSGSPLPEENTLAALHTLSFRVLRDNGHHGRQLTLKEVPPVLLAETWQDLHDIAAKGTGFDPDWQKKVH
ncbi:DUF4132 domain-containing protein [Sphingomonas sp. ZT3P38]|uniref:DUF4132 domain-containing protein n=1 Tax=Parasphingomonas zepuensis TaxID=3096161 RepID=UPI002FC84E5E